jgi:ABC-type cobalamin/Fe3+-siderophores transport systems, ATPase components
VTEIVTRQGLSARDIVVGYGKNDPILEGLSLDVLAGELTVIVGPNACGKSTLLRSLARVLDVRSGVVELDGRSVANINQKALARRLGLLAQSSVAPGDMLVEDLVARGRYPYQSLLRQWSREDDEAVARAMEDAGVAPLAGRRVGELSGGQRQRVWIAMALAQSTEILLLDEPTTYLDLNHQLEVLRLVERLQRAGTTVVAVLHDLHLAFRYATHLVFMKNGEIVAQGAPHDVVTADLVERVFSVPCRIIDDPETGSPLVIPTR